MKSEAKELEERLEMFHRLKEMEEKVCVYNVHVSLYKFEEDY